MSSWRISKKRRYAGGGVRFAKNIEEQARHVSVMKISRRRDGTVYLFVRRAAFTAFDVLISRRRRGVATLHLPRRRISKKYSSTYVRIIIYVSLERKSRMSSLFSCYSHENMYLISLWRRVE